MMAVTIALFAVFGAGFWLGRMWERNGEGKGK